VSTKRIRIEVDDFSAGRGVVLYLTPVQLHPDRAEALAAIIERAVDDLSVATGESRRWAREALLAEVVLRFADDEAYQREAGRRGVLPL
jgi:hypothetical protein